MNRCSKYVDRINQRHFHRFGSTFEHFVAFQLTNTQPTKLVSISYRNRGKQKAGEGKDTAHLNKEKQRGKERPLGK